MKFIKFRFLYFFAFTFFGLFLAASGSHAQSTSQDFPTPVTVSEISGTINARDVGDPRTTSYFYTFGGEQGDLFVNVVTKNFNGDIDVFTASGQRPLTKIVIYSDLSENETGRLIYLRKPEKLVLRIQGRSPNDDAASYRIKFAGSFAAAKDSILPPGLDLPTVNTETEAGIRVNSVGTILETRSKQTPVEKTASAGAGDNRPAVAEQTRMNIPDSADSSVPAVTAKSPELVVSDELPKTEITAETPKIVPRPTRARRTRPGRAVTESPSDIETTKSKSLVKVPATKPLKEKLPNPLENIRLVILLKNGESVERPMSEVFKFSVDKGVLRVIGQDGSVRRYSILDVAKVTIE